MPASRRDSFRRRVNSLYDRQLRIFFGGVGPLTFANTGIYQLRLSMIEYAPTNVEVQFP